MVQKSERRSVWPLLAAMLVLVFGVFVYAFPQNYPDQTLQIEEKVVSFLERITFPITYMRFSMKEPDTELLMPVYDTRTYQISDTWQVPRGNGRSHDGQDIFAPRGTPVFSATNGYVHRARITTIGGYNVMIRGAGGREYYYAHMDRIAEGLRVGREVTTDTVIGFVGNSGNAEGTPTHLHFGMYEGRQAVNPFPLIVNR